MKGDKGGDRGRMGGHICCKGLDGLCKGGDKEGKWLGQREKRVETEGEAGGDRWWNGGIKV